MNILAVLIGGGIGSAARYMLSTFASQSAPGQFPLGTLIVNISGCFFIGLLFELFQNFVITPELRLFIFTGFFGGFTTFSSFGLETVRLFQNGEYRIAFTNILFNNIIGLALVLGGVITARWILMLIRRGSL